MRMIMMWREMEKSFLNDNNFSGVENIKMKNIWWSWECKEEEVIGFENFLHQQFEE